MSTFNGFVPEFPNIRIDYFRTLPGRPPPLACFLSHVHSDHLQGLESLKSPFIYCSATTRELLLRLEKYPYRMNFSKGVLECRKQTYKHLKPLLKPLPLETPTTIELAPGNEIQVTLFDANHCAGAVMFLVEGKGKAILYTGDIRSEEWWVNALIRHPVLLPYTHPSKRLDTIYIDTTFATKTDPHRCFPSKASGLQELLVKIRDYPEGTIFYFQAWTFGYEDVWLALSQCLKSPVHLDRYRYNLYTSVSHNNGQGLECREAPVLGGFKFGNTSHRGILTRDPTVRLHSCERGAHCELLDKAENEIVTITPIICRHDGVEMRELGAGGGHGDLDQIHELDLADSSAVGHLLMLCSRSIKDPTVLQGITDLLSTSLIAKNGRLKFEFPEEKETALEDLNRDYDQETIPLSKLPTLIAALTRKQTVPLDETKSSRIVPQPMLPRSITFPYSRHSSYSELCHLVSVFRPHDVWPCTVPPEDVWHEGLSMATLFGGLCDNLRKGFAFDIEMREKLRERRKRKRDVETQLGNELEEDTQEQQHWEVESERLSEAESAHEYGSAVTHIKRRTSEGSHGSTARGSDEGIKPLNMGQSASSKSGFATNPPSLSHRITSPAEQHQEVKADRHPRKSPITQPHLNHHPRSEEDQNNRTVHSSPFPNNPRSSSLRHSTQPAFTSSQTANKQIDPPTINPPTSPSRLQTSSSPSPHQSPPAPPPPPPHPSHKQSSQPINTTSATALDLTTIPPQPPQPTPPPTAISTPPPTAISQTNTSTPIPPHAQPTPTLPHAKLDKQKNTTPPATPKAKSSERLRARKEAYDKARQGLWHEVRLESVASRGWGLRGGSKGGGRGNGDEGNKGGDGEGKGERVGMEREKRKGIWERNECEEV